MFCANREYTPEQNTEKGGYLPKKAFLVLIALETQRL